MFRLCALIYYLQRPILVCHNGKFIIRDYRSVAKTVTLTLNDTPLHHGWGSSLIASDGPSVGFLRKYLTRTGSATIYNSGASGAAIYDGGIGSKSLRRTGSAIAQLWVCYNLYASADRRNGVNVLLFISPAVCVFVSFCAAVSCVINAFTNALILHFSSYCTPRNVSSLANDIAATTTTATNSNAFNFYPPLYMPPPGTLRKHRRRLFSVKIPSSQQTF